MWYLDTSAALKLLVSEAESEALAESLVAEQPDLVACFLLETELRRAVSRYEHLDHGSVTTLLASVSLYETPPSLFREAGLLPGASLRSLDALHLASALRLGVDAIATYDVRFAEAATALGLAVQAPGTV